MTCGRTILTIGIAVVANSSASGQSAAELSVADRVLVASAINAYVQQYFAHWDGVNRDSVAASYREYVERIVQTRLTRREFDEATLRFMASLRNGHTQFFDTAGDNRPLKFRLLEVEHQWVVLVSGDSRLPRGAVVRTLNGSPVGDVIRDLSRYVAASNDRQARADVFNYVGLFPEKNTLGLADGRTVVVDRSVPRDVPLPPQPQASEGRWIREGQVAYIRIPSFGDQAFEQSAIALVRQFASAPNLIIDVRGNQGGTSPYRLLTAVMNRPRRPWLETSPLRMSLTEANGGPAMAFSREFPVQAPASDAYGGKVFVLVDRFCISACEDFVMPFKDTGRGIVVGETTTGSSGNPFRANLGFGMALRVGAVRYRFPSGAPFEAIGIEPDVVVERRIADIVAGRDAVLDRVLTLIASPREK